MCARGAKCAVTPRGARVRAQWDLVGCDEAGHVKLLTLDFNNLNGTLPRSLGSLRYLQDLDLEGNHLVGSVPSSLGALRSLLQFGLGANRLSGVLPPALCELTPIRGACRAPLQRQPASALLPLPAPIHATALYD